MGLGSARVRGRAGNTARAKARAGAPAAAERGPRSRGNPCPGRRGRRGVAAGVPIEAAWLGLGLGLNYLAQALLA